MNDKPDHRPASHLILDVVPTGLSDTQIPWGLTLKPADDPTSKLDPYIGNW